MTTLTGAARRPSWLRIAAIVFACALALTVTASGTAYGHPAQKTGKARDVSGTVPPGLPCTDSVPAIGVVVCFEADGDKLWINDTRGDGQHAAIAFDTSSLHIGECHDYHGSKAGWTVCDDFAKFIPEHDIIYFSAYRMEGDEIKEKSDEQDASTS